MNKPRSDIHKFKIGRFECSVIYDGFTEYATAGMLFGRAPEKELKEKLTSFGLNPDRIRCFNNCLLIEDDRDIVLIDTGFGPMSVNYPGAEKAGMLFKNMKKYGYDPNDVNKVLFTHYHTDHIGGGLDHNGNPAFSNAVFYMNTKDWQKGSSIESYGKKVLLALKDRMEFFDGDIELLPGIRAIPAPGHTPGHTVIKIESDGGELLCASDLAAHPIHFEFPEWSMAHEYDLDLAAKSRRETFQHAAEKKILLLAYHLPFPGLGYLHKKGDGWSWQNLQP